MNEERRTQNAEPKGLKPDMQAVLCRFTLALILLWFIVQACGNWSL